MWVIYGATQKSMKFAFFYIKAERNSDFCTVWFLYICPAGDEVETRSDQSFWASQKKQENGITTLEVIFKPFNLEKVIMMETVLYDF